MEAHVKGRRARGFLMSFERGFIIGGLIGALLHWCLTHWRGVLLALGLTLLVTMCNGGLSKSHAIDAKRAGMTIRNVGWNRDAKDGFAHNQSIVIEIVNPAKLTLTSYFGSCNDGQFVFSDKAPVAPHSTVTRTLEYDEYTVTSGIPYDPFEDGGHRPCEFTDAQFG
jgi:hypothetical protein